LELLGAGKESKYKIVEGNLGHRKFVNPRKTVKFLTHNGLDKEQIYVTQLISPAQAEKLLPPRVREQVNNYVTRPPGKPTIVPVSDKRRSYTPILDDFDDFEDEPDDGLGD
jgi:hypothetical protein